MAITVSIDTNITGLTGATIKLFQIGSDTAVETITASEYINNKASYYGTVATAPAGDYVVLLADSSGNFIAKARRWIGAAAGVYAGRPDSNTIGSIATDTGTTLPATLATLSTQTSVDSVASDVAKLGYHAGAIWVDTDAANTNTVVGVDGTVSNPVSTLAAAVTLSGTTGINRIRAVGSVALTVTTGLANLDIAGSGGVTINLDSNSATDCTFRTLDITGTATATTGCRFVDCTVQPSALSASVARRCVLSGTVTLTTPGDITLMECGSPTAPLVLDFASYTSASISLHGWSGDCELRNLGASVSQSAYVTGVGTLTINANCTGGIVYYGPGIEIADNSAGAVTFVQVAPVTVTASLVAELVAGNAAGSVGQVLEDLNSRLPVSGTIATQGDVTNITQAQRVTISLPEPMLVPDTGSTDYRVWIYAYNEQHQAEDLDAVPVVSVENQTGTDRSSNRGTVTKETGSTGIYYVDYTVDNAHATEQLIFRIDATENAVTTQYSRSTHTIPESVATAGSPWSPTDVAQVRHRLELDGTATVPTNTALPKVDVTQIETVDATDQLAAIVAADGGGAFAVDLTFVNDEIPAAAIVGAKVRITRSGFDDIALTTDGSGKVYPKLDAATYNVYATAAGHTFYDGTLVVTGAATPAAYEMPLTVSVTNNPPNTITGLGFVHDEAGIAEDGVTVTGTYVAGTGDDGYVRDEKPLTGISSGGGNLAIAGFIRGAQYSFQAGSGTPVVKDIPMSGSTFQIPELSRLDVEA